MTVKAYRCHMDPYPASLGRRTLNPGGPKANNSIASKVYYYYYYYCCYYYYFILK